METKWLEDFVSLAETNSFSRSAELRHVTQPAFSRRIQSLEAWLGSDLIDRTSYPTRLTHAGEVFYEQAIAMLGQINNARALLRGKRTSTQTTIDFAVPHTLSLTYVPRWLTGLESAFGEIHSRLLALNVHDAVMTLVEGGCDLLLCYHHPRQPLLLDASQYDMISMGNEALRAYTRCDKQGHPELLLPGDEHQPLPFLAYANNAYLGRMVDLMALEGRGIAFLPESAVTRELKQKQLARADDSTGAWEVNMEIRLYRERPSLQRPGKMIVSRLWDYLSQLQNAENKKLQKKNRP